MQGAICGKKAKSHHNDQTEPQNLVASFFCCTFAPDLKKHHFMKIELQLIAAFILSLGGLVLLFCGTFIDPQGQIHESLLVAFGETATFSGALFGIDYVYKKKR